MEVTALAAMPFAQTSGADRSDVAFSARADHAGIGHAGQSSPLIAQIQAQDGANNNPSADQQNKDEEQDQRSPLQKAGENAQQAFEEDQLKVSIRYNEDIDRFVFEGLDPESGEVVKQYPDEEFVARIQSFREVTGLAVDERL